MVQLGYETGKKTIYTFICSVCLEYKSKYLAEADFFNISKGGTEYIKWLSIKQEIENTDEKFDVA